LSSLSRGGPVDIIHPRAFEAFRGEERHESGSTLMLYPYRLVEEGYRGYNILQIDVDKFLALGQSEGGYSPQKLVASGYKFAYVGTSIEGAKGKIPTTAVAKSEAATSEPENGKGGKDKAKASKAKPRPDGRSEAKNTGKQQAKRKLARDMFSVRLIEEGYNGFNILQIAADEFLALAQAEGAYSAEKLAAGAYKRAYVASSAKEARRIVKDSSKS